MAIPNKSRAFHCVATRTMMKLRVLERKGAAPCHLPTPLLLIYRLALNLRSTKKEDVNKITRGEVPLLSVA